MKQNSLILPIVGGGIAFLCFFLPWIKLDMPSWDIGNTSTQVKIAINISGFDVAIGSTSFVTLAFLATIVIIGICIYMVNQKTPWKARNLVLICSGIGLGCLLLTFLLVMVIGYSGLRSIGNTTYTSNGDIQFGGLGTAIGFVIIFLGAWNIPKPNASTENNV